MYFMSFMVDHTMHESNSFTGIDFRSTPTVPDPAELMDIYDELESKVFYRRHSASGI
jgi:hypothetical protein